MLLAYQWEGFTQASELQGLDLTTYHQPLPSVENQLCSGRVVVLQHGLYLSMVHAGSGVSQVVQAKVSLNLCSAKGYLLFMSYKAI